MFRTEPATSEGVILHYNNLPLCSKVVIYQLLLSFPSKLKLNQIKSIVFVGKGRCSSFSCDTIATTFTSSPSSHWFVCLRPIPN